MYNRMRKLKNTFNHDILQNNLFLILHNSEASEQCFYTSALKWLMSNQGENDLHWATC